MRNFTTHFMFSSALARKGIMLITAVLFFIGYYYFLCTPIGIIREAVIISISALLCLCVFGSIFLLADSEVNRSRKIFALQMLLVACAAGFTLMRIISGGGYARPVITERHSRRAAVWQLFRIYFTAIPF